MRHQCLVAGTLAGALLAGPRAHGQDAPPARRSDVFTVHHGTTVADPYRWMEEMTAPETLRWVRAQDAHARRFIAGAAGHRERLRAQLVAASRAQGYLPPVAEGGRLFYTRFRALGAGVRATLLVQDTATDTTLRVLVDGDSLRARQGVDPVRMLPSAGGGVLSYAVSRPGSSWQTLRFMEVATGRHLPDSLVGIHRASMASWARRGPAALYYTRYESPPPGQELQTRLGRGRVVRHRVGTAQAEDQVVFELPAEPEWSLVPRVTDDGRYLVVTATHGTGPRTRLYARNLQLPNAPVVPVIVEGDAAYNFVGNDGDTFIVATDFEAPRGRLVAVDVRNPARSRWREIVPQAEETIQTWLPPAAVGGHLIVEYRKDAKPLVKVFDLTGRQRYVLSLPFLGSLWAGFVGTQQEGTAYYQLSGQNDPGRVYRLDVATGRSTADRADSAAGPKPETVTESVLYPGKDGVSIPMLLVYRKDLRQDGSAPVWMYGYGAFGWIPSLYFNPVTSVWIENGGIFALPSTRGGGEHGGDWHRAGSVRRKQTAIDDYVAAAEWLIRNRYTSADRLVANASSAGGVIGAAAVIQHPELFGASLLDYPVLDMMRYDQFTGGRRWSGEYGTVADSADFAALLAYDPMRNLRSGACYPATLVSPGELDATTVPMHAYKYVAALQHAQRRARRCDRPVLLRVSWGAGHAAGATPEESIETWADQLAFLARVLPPPAFSSRR
ncbi:MAG: prolyl oligopeptidase family serine peptidase [Gemmatimonadales bacterium]